MTPKLSLVIPTFNNVKVLQQCLESWEQFGGDAPIELVVIEDGCRDETPAFLESAAATPWGREHLRWIHETNVHELRATNRGLREARAPLIMTWHDDMFVRVPWLASELIRIFERYPDIGLLCMSRGLTCTPCETPLATWTDAIDWKRLQSTIGQGLANWWSLYEVDAVVRPWVVRRECIDRVGVFDEAFVPTGWDESDLAFRIREAGWRVAVHGYERARAFKHLGSTTFTKYSLNLERDLQNARLFYGRWERQIAAGADRRRHRWRRPMSADAWASMVRTMIEYAVPARRRLMLSGQW
ncbi:MAG TPA: glycosyltransferase [Vicinamibacterales bacterium]|nr:glycosyltransferase [Vicinamibacterales bacterium]